LVVPPIVSDSTTKVDTTRESMNSVVRISANTPDGTTALTGSGWANSKDTILTAGHVCWAIISLQKAGVLEDNIDIHYLNRVDALSKISGVEIVDVSDKDDICLLYSENHGLPVLQFEESKNIKFNGVAIVLGFPLGVMITYNNGTIIVPDTGNYFDIEVLRNKLIVSSASTSGNSGGPVINEHGKVIGMLIAGPSNGYDHLSVCVTVDSIKSFIK